MADHTNLAAQAVEYWTDAWQRSILFMDVLYRRGTERNARERETAPHVLNFDFETVIDGRTLPRPVNYSLMRIIPPKGVEIDGLTRPRPFNYSRRRTIPPMGLEID